MLIEFSEQCHLLELTGLISMTVKMIKVTW